MCRLACVLMATRYENDYRNSHYNRHQCYNSQNRLNNEHSSQRKDKHAYYYSSPASSSKKRFRNYASDIRQKDSYKEEQDEGDYKKQDSKQKIQSFGDWSEHRSSSGKIYYYNSQTEVSQWEKPSDWVQAEKKRSSLGEKNRTKTHHSFVTNSSAGSQGFSDAYHSIGGPSCSMEHQENSSPRSTGLSQGSTSPYQQRTSRDFVRTSRTEGSASLSASEQRPLKRERNSSPATDRSTSSSKKRMLTFAEASLSATVDFEERKEDGSLPGFLNKAKSAPAQLDLSKLPHLLVELAQKYGIDLHEERAVDKLKLYLKKAVSPNAAVPSHGISGPSKSIKVESSPLKDEFMDTSPSCSNSSEESKREERKEKPKPSKEVEEKEKDSLPPLSTASHEKFCKEHLVRHVRGWSAEYFEAQSWIWAGSLLSGSVQLGQIMADMKCARSLVRTAEIRSTLIDQRVIFVRQQMKQYDPQNKPSGGGGSGSVASGGSS